MVKEQIQLPPLEQSPANEMLLTLGFQNLVCCNNYIDTDISTHIFFYSIIGENLRQWQFIQKVFQGKNDIQLTVLDTFANTPFRCFLLALLVRQMRLVLGIRYSKVRIMVTPLSKESSRLIGLADDNFSTTKSRNHYLHDALQRIVESDCSVACKGNHIHAHDIVLETKEFKLILTMKPGITKGWRIGMGAYSFITPEALLDNCKTDIPCYNIVAHGEHKNGVYVNAQLDQKSQL